LWKLKALLLRGFFSWFVDARKHSGFQGEGQAMLDFVWEELGLSELIASVFVMFGCFGLFNHLLRRAEEKAQKRRLRKWLGQ